MVGYFLVDACALDVEMIAIHYFCIIISAMNLLSNTLKA